MTRKEAAFIRQARVGILATVDEHGQPLNVPFCFAFDGACLYSPIDEKPKAAGPRELKRIRNIRANPRVSVVVQRYDDEDWSRLAHIIIHGEARILTDGDTHGKAVRLLRRKYSQYRTMALDQRPVIQIRVVRCIRWGRV
ncbi:MAG: TIGR03668 family PPOX class F420-dependent oxidoreductase [Deltaproteobacteria bacterium]|nr:TIGR03668 family PPOX class F420-dependent oxidoreductase [Deltaproteobacteria bacterium]